MNFKSLVQDNWKKAVVAGLVFAAGMYAGPIGGKAVGFLAPKVLDRVSDTPITDLKNHESPFRKDPLPDPKAPQVVVKAPRATLAGVEKDWGITGRLDCRVVQGPQRPQR